MLYCSGPRNQRKDSKLLIRFLRKSLRLFLKGCRAWLLWWWWFFARRSKSKRVDEEKVERKVQGCLKAEEQYL